MIWIFFPTRREANSLPGRNVIFSPGIVAQKVLPSHLQVFSFVIGMGVHCLKRVNCLVDGIASGLVTKPDWIILSGYAGACQGDLATGDTILATQVSYLGERFPLFHEKISAMETLRLGPMASVDNIASEKEKGELKKKDFLAVEMEAGQILKALGARLPCPMIMVRVILDRLGYNFPAVIGKALFSSTKTSWFWTMKGFLNPWNWGELVSLWKMSKKANVELHKVLKMVILGLNSFSLIFNLEFIRFFP